MLKKIMLVLAVLLLAACGEKGTEKGSEKAEVKDSAQALAQAEKHFIKEEPKSKVTVLAARKLEAGKSVTVEGVILGKATPIVKGRAAFVIGDPSVITSCDLREGDNCKTPWDCCCDSKKDIARATLNIQIVDADGMVLKTDIRDIEGLTENSRVVIKGTVDKTSTDKAMTINAESIFVD